MWRNNNNNKTIMNNSDSLLLPTIYGDDDNGARNYRNWWNRRKPSDPKPTVSAILPLTAYCCSTNNNSPGSGGGRSSLLVRKRGGHVPWRKISLLALALLLYQECISYKLVRWRLWDQPDLTDSTGTDSAASARSPSLDGRLKNIKILLVADPQLQGYRDEPPFIVGYITRWDSDRYLRKTFADAYWHSQPDLVIFLGDLLDEGYTCTMDEYKWTRRRFYHVYSLIEENSTPVIFISGDNDVGGEYESVNDERRQLFRESFVNRPLPTKFQHLKFTVGNVFDGSYIELIGEKSANESKSNQVVQQSSVVNILLTHHPVLRTSRRAAEDIRSAVQPSLILSSHDHYGTITDHHYPSSQTDKNDDHRRIGYRRMYRNTFRNVAVNLTTADGSKPVELQIPTASYRMGTPDMALALLTIRPSASLSDHAENVGSAASVHDDQHYQQFSVNLDIYWLPKRFPQLISYAAFLVGLAAYLLVRTLVRNC